MPDRATTIRAVGAVLAVTLLGLLFIASYAGALHDPKPHELPVAVSDDVPARATAGFAGSDAFSLDRYSTAQDALHAVDRRDAYGALVAAPNGLELVVAPAASPAIARILVTDVAGALRAAGATVAVRTVHPLSATDTDGLVAFYLVIGWAVTGYVGATFLGLIFGTRPSRRRAAWRLVALAGLGILTGLCGALVATAIAGYDHGLLTMAAIGFLTVVATGAVTVALQTLLGLIGTGVAILLFVVYSNPAAGGAYAIELLPGFWRVGGPLVPSGAATTAVRDAAYFPDASIGGPLLVLTIWLVLGVVASLAFARRGRGMSDAEQEASLMGVS